MKKYIFITLRTNIRVIFSGIYFKLSTCLSISCSFCLQQSVKKIFQCSWFFGKKKLDLFRYTLASKINNNVTLIFLCFYSSSKSVDLKVCESDGQLSAKKRFQCHLGSCESSIGFQFFHVFSFALYFVMYGLYAASYEWKPIAWSSLIQFFKLIWRKHEFKRSKVIDLRKLITSVYFTPFLNPTLLALWPTTSWLCPILS